MMTCKQVRRLLRERADANLVGAREILDRAPEEARRHLEECPACREDWRRMRDADTLLRQAAMNAPAAPESLHARIQQTIANEPAPARGGVVLGIFQRFSQAAPPWLAAAAVMLIIASSALYFRERGDSASPARHKALHDITQIVMAPPRETALQEAPRLTFALASVFQTPEVIESAPRDFQWLRRALVAPIQKPFAETPRVTIALASVFSAPEAIESAPRDFKWLGRALVGQTESAARAFGVQTPEESFAPGQTPSAIQ